MPETVNPSACIKTGVRKIMRPDGYACQHKGGRRWIIRRDKLFAFVHFERRTEGLEHLIVYPVLALDV